MSPEAQRPKLLIETLASRHNRKAFFCGIDTLDRYLIRQAGQDARKHVAATFVLVETNNPIVLGFYTLSATSVQLDDLPEKNLTGVACHWAGCGGRVDLTGKRAGF